MFCLNDWTSDGQQHVVEIARRGARFSCRVIAHIVMLCVGATAGTAESTIGSTTQLSTEGTPATQTVTQITGERFVRSEMIIDDSFCVAI